MRFATLIELPEYKTLEVYVKRSLNAVNDVYGSNHTEFVSFLGSLLVSEEYKTIFNPDRKILLLLQNIDLFWFNEQNVQQNDVGLLKELKKILLLCCMFLFKTKAAENNRVDPYKELKKIVVLCCVLNYLKTFVETSSRFKNDENVNGFIAERITEIDIALDGMDEDLNIIFLDNNGFIENRGELSISHEIRTDSSIIGMVLFTFGLFDALIFGFNLIVVLLIGWLTQYKDACLDDLIESFEGFFLYSAGFYVFSLMICSLPFIAKKIIDRAAEKALKSLSFDEFMTECRTNPKLLYLMPLIAKSLDGFWLLGGSQLADSADKNPALYRIFLRQQWGYLESDFEEKTYFSLMYAAIFNKKIPLFTDTDLYTSPLDILRRPKKYWTRDTPLNSLTCKPVLQYYGQLATTELLLEKLHKSKTILPRNNRKVIAVLNSNSIKLKRLITLLNSSDWLDKIKMACVAILRIVFLVFAAVSGVLLIHSYAHRSPILSLVAVLSFLSALLFYAENVDSVEKTIRKPIKNFLEKRNAIPVAKFIEKYSDIFIEQAQTGFK